MRAAVPEPVQPVSLLPAFADKGGVLRQEQSGRRVGDLCESALVERGEIEGLVKLPVMRALGISGIAREIPKVDSSTHG